LSERGDLVLQMECEAARDGLTSWTGGGVLGGGRGLEARCFAAPGSCIEHTHASLT
jgi:hypothetical protein